MKTEQKERQDGTWKRRLTKVKGVEEMAETMEGKVLTGKMREKLREAEGTVLEGMQRDGKGSHKGVDTGIKRQEGVRKEKWRDGRWW